MEAFFKIITLKIFLDVYGPELEAKQVKNKP